MKQFEPSFREVVAKTTVTHTVTYFVFGILAYVILDYKALYADTSLNLLMRPTEDPLVMAGPLFQPIRGFLLGCVFYLLRGVVFEKARGWLVLWCTLLVVGILSTFGPTPGSLEGMVYTTLPISIQLRGLPEVVLQSLALSAVLVYWVKHREKKWLSWTLGTICFFALLLPAMGLLVERS